LGGPARVEALANAAADETRSLLEHLQIIRSVLFSQFLSAAEAADRQGVALISGRLLESLRELGRLTGELRQVAGISVTNNVVNLLPTKPGRRCRPTSQKQTIQTQRRKQMTAEPLDIELPLWLQVQRKAKREAWEALPPDERERGRAAQAEWRKRKALETAARRKANSARMRLIVARYYCGVSAEAIGAEIGLSAEGVRKFAAKHGFVITAGPHVFRSFSFCALI
jgi:hypothetical protein